MNDLVCNQPYFKYSSTEIYPIFFGYTLLMRIFNKSKGILSKLTPNFGKNFNLPTDLHTSLTFIEASPSEVVETPFSKHGDFDADKSETGTL